MKLFQFYIPAQLPGMNEIINNSRRIKYWKNKRHSLWDIQRKELIEKIQQIILLENTDNLKFNRAHFEFTWYEPNKRRDPDNIAAAKKIIFDAMILAGLIDNDGWKQVASFSDKFEINKKHPSVNVRVIDAFYQT